MNNLHAITLGEDCLRPMIATHYASVQLDCHPLGCQRKVAHQIFQRAPFDKLVIFTVQLYLQFRPMKGE